MTITRAALALMLLTAVGCEEDMRAPPLSPEGGAGTAGFGGPPPTGGNGGMAGSDEDSGATPRDAGTDADTELGAGFLLGECVDGEDVRITNAVSTPTDLPVTRVFARWIGHCGDPVLEIGLSNGTCRDPGEHLITIQIDATAITDDLLIIPGGNQIVTERPDEPIRIRYDRPASLDLFPSGTWGTCAGVFGELAIESLDERGDDPLRAELGVTLAACNSATMPASLPVVVAFDIDLATRLTDVCPP